jgi:hypothetical protein
LERGSDFAGASRLVPAAAKPHRPGRRGRERLGRSLPLSAGRREGRLSRPGAGRPEGLRPARPGLSALRRPRPRGASAAGRRRTVTGESARPRAGRSACSSRARSLAP